MYRESRSGRSSRSTLMQTKSRLSRAAISGSANDSRSITWHQWQLAYPMESRTGLSSAAARDHASSPHGYQSTGLDALRRRYGLVSSASRFGIGWELTSCRPCYPGLAATPAGVALSVTGNDEAD